MPEEVKPRRQYRSAARTRQREATRAAIVDAATAGFIENGYPATTIAQIAARAQVSAETVYAVFGTKRDLLRAVVEGASAGAPSTDAWQTGDWLALVRAEPTQRRRLELITDATRDVLRRVAPIDEIVRSVAASDPDIAELQSELERRRRSDLRGLVQLLAEAGPLRLSIDHAVDLWWALGHSTGPYRSLTVDRGWSDRRARTALIDVVARALLPDA
ncbi:MULTISPECIES: TetR/AcrR family transcriptional regulator [Mycolicibacter]|uniref:TetR/AcrR family transcriptional regulator n=1 Tax=[Mycobacterium] vasticus TaxID=2875777 RepID=A0ABU5Z0P3_9MYCO|nr:MULTISPECIES: TetR/AcrR family transcriptional regulator [unclassified Mycolicibacter]MEB3064413.1 TetR/AcrR family transcriptional regulator [Mycolicibacter sp. MYC101]MEB3070199.1 TetR/AcrR family transcriptional regulator [Mycolicibacter sp. MYC017]